MVAAFFGENPDFFTGRAKRIVSYEDKDNMCVELKKYLNAKPQNLLDTLHNVFDNRLCELLKVDDWGFVDELTCED